MSFESYIVFYNKELVNKYLGGKLPETMDELIAMANKVKADSGGEVAGAAMRGLRTDTNIDTISGLVFNAWGERSIEGPYGVWFDGDWDKPRLDDPAIQKGLSDYAGLMQAGPSDILSYNWNEAGNAFCNGQAAFLFLLTSSLAPLINLSYMRMVLMALPYTIVLSVVGFISIIYFL